MLQLDVNCAHDGCSLKILHILVFVSSLHYETSLIAIENVILHVQKNIRAERATILGTCRKCFVRGVLVSAQISIILI